MRLHNVHIEVHYPAGTEPSFTQPSALHAIPMHHEFPKVGLPARIARIGTTEVLGYVEDLNDPAVFTVPVSGTVGVDGLVNASLFSGLRYLRSDFVSAHLAGNGENPGVARVELWLRPAGAALSSAVLLGALDTDADCAAPQVAHRFDWDTTLWPNGTYELSLEAVGLAGREEFSRLCQRRLGWQVLRRPCKGSTIHCTCRSRTRISSRRGLSFCT